MAIITALSLASGKILGAAKSIPWQLWAIGAFVLAIGIGGCVHLRNDKAAVKAADKAGYNRAMDEVRARALEIERKARELEAKITPLIRSKVDAENRAIADRQHSLRLRGPGKAACAVSAAVSSGAGRHNPSGGRTDSPAAGVLEPDRIAVPFEYIVTQGSTCDLNRTEVIAWREWHKAYTEAWKQLER